MFKFQADFIQLVLQRNAALDTQDQFSLYELFHILHIWYTATPELEAEYDIGRIEAIVGYRSELACQLIDWA